VLKARNIRALAAIGRMVTPASDDPVDALLPRGFLARIFQLGFNL
jgi:hypothetical protein